MSSFVVDANTINRIVRAMHTTRGYPDIPEPVHTAPMLDVRNREKAEELAKKLFEMNVRAVIACYGEREPSSYARSCTEETYTPDLDGVPTPDPMQLYKSICCLLYQCAEGTIPNSPLYIAMDRYAGHVAGHIVKNLPAWEGAEWG